MDVLDGKDLVLPLNLSPQDEAVFQTPVPTAVLVLRGVRDFSLDSGPLKLPAYSWFVYFSDNRRQNFVLN